MTFGLAMAIGDCQSPMGSVGLVMVSFAMALGTFRQTIDETNWMAIYTIGLMLNLVSICFELNIYVCWNFVHASPNIHAEI